MNKDMDNLKNWESVISSKTIEKMLKNKKKVDFEIFPFKVIRSKANRVCRYLESANGNLCYRQYFITEDGRTLHQGYVS